MNKWPHGIENSPGTTVQEFDNSPSAILDLFIGLSHYSSFIYSVNSVAIPWVPTLCQMLCYAP